MRTTIELTDSTYRTLRSEMLDRGERGFSRIVEEALVQYFAGAPERERLRAAIAAAKGAWSDGDAAELERRRAEVWSKWPTDRFSIPTS